MPLDEREQRILDEIEKRLYEEDPKFQERVRKATQGSKGRILFRLAVVTFVLGLVVMLATFTSSRYLAGAGFVVMVASAGWIAMTLRSRRIDQPGASVGSWLDGFRQRWRRDN